MKRPVYVQYVFIFRKPSTAGISFSLLLFAFCCLQNTTLHSVPYLSAYAAQRNSPVQRGFRSRRRSSSSKVRHTYTTTSKR
jgi:hypothetical protein